MKFVMELTHYCDKSTFKTRFYFGPNHICINKILSIVILFPVFGIKVSIRNNYKFPAKFNRTSGINNEMD